MTFVSVAVPVLRGKRRFIILKGRPWSGVEHLILQSLAKAPKSVRELAEASTLPRRLVIEMLIRLMRVGWVEIAVGQSGSTFRATSVGAEQAAGEELPSPSRSTKRWIPFVVDQITGTPYRARDFPSFSRAKVEAREKLEKIIWLKPERSMDDFEPRDLLTNLTEEDEQIIGFDASHEKFSDLYAVVAVRDGKVEGLPGRAPAFLESQVLVAAQSEPDEPLDQSEKRRTHIAEVFAPEPELRQAVFGVDDLVVGGPAHEARLASAIQKAASRIIIHSTFVSADGLNAVLSGLKQAANRGVRVDILWGQGENSPKSAETRALLGAFREVIAREGYEGRIILHPHSTGSHAKILIADDDSGGRFSATVGSCNWLSAAFGSFDVSVKSRDPGIVSDLFNVVAKMTRGRDGHWADWTAELVQLSLAACEEPAPKGLKAEACLVLGADHGRFMRKARDQAERRIFVASHRWSEIGNRSIVIPAISAVEANGSIQARIYYNQVSGRLTNSDATSRMLELRESGVSIQPVHEPRLHAKLLAWDDDSILITSLNWLSADVSQDNPLQEVGIFVRFPRVADDVIRVFDKEHLS